MELPVFSTGSLVTCNSEIYEVVDLILSREGYSYKVELRTYMRDMETREWENQIHSFQTTIEEQKLEKFDFKKPKYTFGERVKPRDGNCIIRFIKFESYQYMSHVRDITRHGLNNYGSIIEESYLSK